MKGLSDVITKLVSSVASLGAWSSFLCLLSLFVIITAGVASRYLLNVPILGVDELSGYLNVLIGFLALGYALQGGKHVTVDIVTSKLSQRTRTVLYLISSIVAILLVAQLIRTSLYTWILLIARDERAQTYLRTPLSIPYGFMVLGWVIFFLALLVELGSTIVRLRNKNPL
jgi:C4-dicarboxylate transporter, DctQ subunit